jgi:FAD/FMN-containing dehydrogenase
MAFQLFSAASAGTAILIIATLFVARSWQTLFFPKVGTGRENDLSSSSTTSFEPSLLAKALASAIPESVILPNDSSAFSQSRTSYWAQQECEVVPACVVRPRDIQELSTAVKVLKIEFGERDKLGGDHNSNGVFAIRSGGHSPVPEAASIQGGVLIDMSLFCEVSSSEDGSRVVIGAGAKWMTVSKTLDERGLAVVGGRNSAVGVGGLTLGGMSL